MTDRMDIQITVAPHICIVSKGPRLWSLWRARDFHHFWCKQDGCDKWKVRWKAATLNSTYRGATIESVLGSCGDRWRCHWARCKVEFACACEHSVYRALALAVEWTGSTSVRTVWLCWEQKGERNRRLEESLVYPSRGIEELVDGGPVSLDLSHNDES